MRKPLELIGKKFGKLTVLSKNLISTKSNNSCWDCICDCGTTSTVVGSKLINGHTTSCGCFRIEQARAACVTHGMRSSSEYAIWCGIKNRCLNTQTETYVRYGERGINICDSWLNSFENFYADMGPRPSPDHSVERKNNDGNYEPNNCVWGTYTEQANNRRSNSHYEHNGVTKTIAEWARLHNVVYHKLHKRLLIGWTFEKAITTP